MGGYGKGDLDGDGGRGVDRSDDKDGGNGNGNDVGVDIDDLGTPLWTQEAILAVIIVYYFVCAGASRLALYPGSGPAQTYVCCAEQDPKHQLTRSKVL